MRLYDLERLPRYAALDFTEIQTAVELPPQPESPQPSQPEIVEIRLPQDASYARIVEVLNAVHDDPYRFRKALLDTCENAYPFRNAIQVMAIRN